MKALDIIYEEVSEDFRISEGKLFRLWRGIEWREVNVKSDSRGYCQVKWEGKMYKVHRILYSLYHKVDVNPNLQVDHLDGNRINNTKDNLRLVTNRQNTQNRVIHREGRLQGTTLNKAKKKWEAKIRIGGEQIFLGSYETELQAHEAYLKACSMIDKTVDEIKKHFGVAQFTSKHKGVHFHKASGKYQARITIDGKQKHLGLFNSELEAAEAVARQ